MMNKIIILLFAAFILQGCSSYRANFGCPDAKGYQCMPLSLVDKKIDNGQIEELDHNYSKKARDQKILPKMQTKEIIIDDNEFEQELNEVEDDHG